MMSDPTEFAGMAALSIYEAPSLSLNNQKLLPERQAARELRAAVTAHENAPTIGLETKCHQAVADLINAIIATKNTVRCL
ncbi:hypothetical protein [uncultured Ruegeria sp.]|uniref:hypothetical protein n=1 Tax=uncultured Ruegeria sp. TaxID=259304 RepID=UPI002623BCBC|nr:hypothetical protein [uncultured Ruegeria sp.]